MNSRSFGRFLFQKPVCGATKSEENRERLLRSRDRVTRLGWVALRRIGRQTAALYVHTRRRRRRKGFHSDNMTGEAKNQYAVGVSPLFEVHLPSIGASASYMPTPSAPVTHEAPWVAWACHTSVGVALPFGVHLLAARTSASYMPTPSAPITHEAPSDAWAWHPTRRMAPNPAHATQPNACHAAAPPKLRGRRFMRPVARGAGPTSRWSRGRSRARRRACGCRWCG